MAVVVVDPEMGKTNDGEIPPVVHVDTDAPLHSTVDGSLITDEMWLPWRKDANRLRAGALQNRT